MSAPWLASRAISARPISEIPQDVKDTVKARAGGRCECCGRNLITGNCSYHHRRAKGMGGSRDASTHTTANVVLICGRDNKTGCHGDVHGNPIEARAHGWIVRQGALPARIQIVLHDGRTVFLGDSYEALPTEETA